MAESFLYLDFETSGLNPGRHGILQAAWILEKNGTVLHERSFDVQLDAGCDIALEALQVNHRTFGSLLDGKTVSAMLATLRMDLMDCGVNVGARIKIVGHRVDFDIGFLKAANAKHPSGIWSYLDYDGLDTCAMARWLNCLGILKTQDCRLETLCNFYGIPIEAHDALQDVKAVYCITKIFKGSLMNMVEAFENAAKIA
jgi:DNA polymerase III alpha subunit (gram-positive type)